MGIENRDYYRGSSSGTYRPSGFSDMPVVCKRLLTACIAMFLVQIFFTRSLAPEELRAQFEERRLEFNERDGDGAYDDFVVPEFGSDDIRSGEMDSEEFRPNEFELNELSSGTLLLHPKVSFAEEWLALDPDKVKKGQVWRLVSYAFLHDRYGVWHLIINMLFLYWFGTRLEQMYGSQEFCLFYFSAAIVAGLSFLALDYYTGSPAVAIGASGAVWGLVSLYVIHYPYERIEIYGTFPVEIRWLALIYILFDLHPVLLAINGEGFVYGGVAYAAHVGGAAFGFAYFYRSWRLTPLWNRLTRQSSTGKWQSRTVNGKGRAVIPMRDPENLDHGSNGDRSQPIDPLPKKLEAQLDAILEKIQTKGRESLTDEEIEILATVSEQLRKR